MSAPLLTRREAAAALGISPVTVDRLRKCGKLTYRVIGNRLVRFLEADLETYLEKAATTGAKPCGAGK
jgi:excisionase family DNA binding protein